MPRYRYDGTGTLNYRGMQLANGEIGSPIPNVYLTDEEATPLSLVLVGHNYSPVRKLHAAVIGGGVSLTNLCQFSSITVYNTSGADLTLTINSDATNTVVIPNGVEKLFEYHRDIYSISIAGAGGSAFYVYGYVPSLPR